MNDRDWSKVNRKKPVFYGMWVDTNTSKKIDKLLKVIQNNGNRRFTTSKLLEYSVRSVIQKYELEERNNV